MIQMNCIYRGIFRRDSFWDWLVFKKIQDGLGGRVRLIISGSAPISKEVSYINLVCREVCHRSFLTK